MPKDKERVEHQLCVA